MDRTMASSKNIGKKVLVMVAALMGVTAVLFLRTDGEHRIATASETTSLFENSYLAHHPGTDAVRFDHVEWSDTLLRLDISPDPTAQWTAQTRSRWSKT